MNKEMENQVPRPTLVLTAVIAHGYCTCLFVSHEGQDHGSDLHNTCIYLTMQEVFRVCAANNWPVPLNFFVLVASLIIL